MSATSFGLLADLEADLNITAAAAIDSQLQRMLDAATQFIKTYCSHDMSFPPTTYTENYDGNDGTYLGLNQYPISTITSLLINNYSVPAAPDPWTYGYLTDSKLKGIHLVGAPSVLTLSGFSYTTFVQGIQNVRISYTAGYADQAHVPSDIQQACRAIAASMFKRMPDINATSRAVGNQGNVGISQRDMDATTKQILNRYRRMN